MNTSVSYEVYRVSHHAFCFGPHAVVPLGVSGKQGRVPVFRYQSRAVRDTQNEETAVEKVERSE